MTSKTTRLSEKLDRALAGLMLTKTIAYGEVTIEVAPDTLHQVCQKLQDDESLAFEQLSDLCGVDYSEYGCTEWATEESSSTGFSRGVDSASHSRLKFGDDREYVNTSRPRFAVVYQLISYRNNHRLRMRVSADNEDMPVVPTVVDFWAGANWYEREAYDLFGIHFDNHPDLRRILTDYGFVGHPFRKDFPLIGHVEMRYDAEQKRVIYQPVTIEPRVLVPRVIRNDNRYHAPVDDDQAGDKGDA